MNRFRDKLTNTNDFVYSIEMVPGRGLEDKNMAILGAFTDGATACGKIDILSFTDNPGGNTRLSPDFIAKILKKDDGPSVLVHTACKDMNRAWMESRLYQLNKMGIENILALSGDYPVPGYKGTAKPVFDLDSASLLKLVDDMNGGLQISGPRPGSIVTLTPSNLFPGAAVSMFKKEESELFMQYSKMGVKVKNGAKFIYTQLGYNARKFDELIKYTKAKKINVPLIGNVYVLHKIVSRMMHQDLLPGCVVTKSLYDKVLEWSKEPDKGKSKYLDFAAKQVAICRGLGYRGVHIGGFGLKFDDMLHVINESERIAEKWREFIPELTFEQEDEFYMFEKDESTGLNTNEWNPALKRKQRKTLSYTLMKIMHAIVFSQKSPFFGLTTRILGFIDKRESLERKFAALEHSIKFFTNHCHNCGDCALPNTTYLCPEENCAKRLRNGPCGGSYKGKCEVFKHRECLWVRVFKRRKSFNELKEIEEYQMLPRNWELYHKSSWVNFFTGKDNQKLQIKSKDDKSKGKT